MTKQTTTKPVFNAISVITAIAQSQYLKDSATETLANAKETLQTNYKSLLDNKVIFGKDSRTCAYAKAFKDALTGIQVNGKQYYAAGTIRNYVSAMRGALATRTKTLDLNRSRTEKKTTGTVKGTNTKNSVDPKSRKASKAKTTEGAKTIAEKLEVQIENCISILQSIDEGDVVDFDVDTVNQLLCDLQAEIA